VAILVVALVVGAYKGWAARGRPPARRGGRTRAARRDAANRTRLGASTIVPVLADDPRMAEARRRARETLAEFGKLLTKSPKGGFIKSSIDLGDDSTHIMWGQFLGRTEDGRLRILLGPTDSGFVPPDPERTIHSKEIVDRMNVAPDGKIHGAFTERALIRTLRERGRPLPESLEVIERSLADPWMPS